MTVVLHLLVQLLDLHPHLGAQFGVKVRQRFVEQEHVRMRTMARPMATRWRWPPDSWLGGGPSAASATGSRPPR
jgi:hypothetical protein